MTVPAKIENGFASVGAGTWLMGRAQPAACLGNAVRRRWKGWRVPDRSKLSLVETSAETWCADATRPFLTFVPAAAPASVVSEKLLLAPADARSGGSLVRAVPLSARGALTVTEFASGWAVFATRSRTARLVVEDGDTLSVRPESVVAWTGPRPTGFCPKLGLLDLILPRGPRNLLFHFHGPAVVWVEGAVETLLSAFGRPLPAGRTA